MADENDFRHGDTEQNLLRKILNRLKDVVAGLGGGGGGGDVTLTVSDIEIGAVELKDADTDNRAKIRNSDPDPGDNGIVVRNIPSGTQVISGSFLTDTQLRATPVPVSGTVTATGPLTDAQLRASPVPLRQQART